MTTVADVLQFLEALAPASTKMDWDNVGLLCGRKDKEVHRILVALDPFRNVIREAILEHADLIVTHHPLIFRDPLKAVNEDTEAGRCVLTLIEHGIAAINAHTNLDVAPGGINDVLASTLGLDHVEVLNPVGVTAGGKPYGLLRAGTVEEQSLPVFLQHVKTRLHCESLRYVQGRKRVHKVAVGGGACADGMFEALEAGCDTFVTSDIRYNQFWTAYEMGLNLIDAGHFHTENPAMPVLARKLAQQFPDVSVRLSETHADCVNFW